ncbi:hypothetical protein L7F22_063669 [Adiantum nelumboides]|nr:hypothetical protein [Adiantum nelumboides]
MIAAQKTAKGRLDKFYHLAKQQGFRSRAAFKLVQLNKKYAFLEKSRCCIDLCAAPGGWLQVASKQMPPGSLIVGVDLVPIKPIPRCITFAEDINSYKCRDQLRTELKDWKADVVLHDGAPNVGTAWVQDAYAQSELVLQSLKLAVEFLAPGGNFVTKVFRSKDYNNLIWVFNQLFRRVEATKPPSSRNVSAEIFVVCQEFKAPKRIDPKFLDPRYVFKDLDPTAATKSTDDKTQKPVYAANAVANVFEPEKKRRKREGYAEGEMLLYKAISAKDFIEGDNPVEMLGTFNEIRFRDQEDKRFLEHELTDENLKACCADLKVLGKKDFRNLIKWRKTLREEMGLELSAKDQHPSDERDGEEVAEVQEMDEDEMIDSELARLKEEKDRRARKERRRKNEATARKVQKMQLSMTTPMDIGMEIEDEALHGGDDFFDLKHGGAKGEVARGEEPEYEDSDAESKKAGEGEEDEDGEDEKERRLRELEGEMDGMYEEYRQRKAEEDAKFRIKEARRKDENRDEWYGFEKKGDDMSESEGSESEGGYDIVQKRKEAEETYDTDDEEDEEDERAEAAERGLVRGTKRKAQREMDEDEEEEVEQDENLVNDLESKDDKQARQSREAAIWFDNPLFKGLEGLEADDDDDDEDSDEDEEDEEDEDGDDDDDDDEEEAEESDIQEKGLTTAEAITLASSLVNREKTKEDLIDMGFTKSNFSYDKEGLPKWFLDDESQFYKANVPITKEAVAALRAKMRALDARPIKKVAEAKARKKYKAAQRLEKARKKAEGVSENVDISEREKAKDIDRLLRRAGKAPKKREVQVVVAKGKNRGLKGRPKGTKGRYRMVDPRQKKELRAMKRKDKREGKKTTSSTSKQRRVPNGYGGR